jgi:hypothetical protein
MNTLAVCDRGGSLRAQCRSVALQLSVVRVAVEKNVGATWARVVACASDALFPACVRFEQPIEQPAKAHAPHGPSHTHDHNHNQALA